MKKLCKRLFVFTVLLFSLSSRAQDPTFNLNNQVTAALNNQNQSLQTLKEQIEVEVGELSNDVSKTTNGELSFPNWVRFVQIAQSIDSLNDIWNEAYSNALNSIIQTAVNTGATNVTQSDYEGQEYLSDIIEAQHLLFPADIASVSFETKFNFVSLRAKLEEDENTWLSSMDADRVKIEQAPTFLEQIGDEQYWTLLTHDRRYVIEDKNVTEPMLGGDLSTEESAKLLDTIKEIVDLLGDLVEIAEGLHNLFQDCEGSTATKVSNIREGFRSNDGRYVIGFEMEQKGQTIDFANKTITKIKGKAKIYKRKNNGKLKKDRKNKVGINFCAKEWNNCEGREWPSDAGSFDKGRVERNKKAKIAHREPKALAVEKSWHFVQFKFGINGIFERALNLFGNQGCTVSSNTNW